MSQFLRFLLCLIHIECFERPRFRWMTFVSKAMTIISEILFKFCLYRVFRRVWVIIGMQYTPLRISCCSEGIMSEWKMDILCLKTK
jgi:hypothetical protein